MHPLRIELIPTIEICLNGMHGWHGGELREGFQGQVQGSLEIAVFVIEDHFERKVRERGAALFEDLDALLVRPPP
jgi:hypothetical protein